MRWQSSNANDLRNIKKRKAKIERKEMNKKKPRDIKEVKENNKFRSIKQYLSQKYIRKIEKRDGITI